MSTSQPRRESAWKHFLDGTTPGQRLIIQLGAIATAPARHRGRGGPNSSGRCSTTRVQAPEDQPAEQPPDGVWYRGCWAVTMDGNGFGAEPLDLELRKQDDTCPG